ncbi:MAG: hypothetical protein M0C28_20385 [Candidatus Moduliflexus flocculans]|nr:hypothetical protein [Candidatus Moduliflexus flocculans]
MKTTLAYFGYHYALGASASGTGRSRLGELLGPRAGQCPRLRFLGRP